LSLRATPKRAAALEGDLLDRVREASPGFFESLIVDLLIAMGYGGGRAEMGQAIGRAGDGHRRPE
jgi:restriction system protein